MPRLLPSFAFAATLIATLCATPLAAQTAAPVVFEAPAGRRPAGPTSPGAPFDRVLPSGRIIHPAGTSVVVGMNALGMTLSPDGRYAIVSNDDDRDANAVSNYDGITSGGYSLCVVDTASMRVVDRYRAAGETFYAGVVAVTDPANPANVLVLAAGGPSNVVYALDLDAAGHLSADAEHTIAMPVATDQMLATAGEAFPSTIVVSRTASKAYVVNSASNDVATIDLATRTVGRSSIPVGFAPFGAASSGAGLLVANEGLVRYGKLSAPAAAPPFASPAVDLANASSVSYVSTDTDDSLGAVKFSVPLDRGPDGIREVGGTQPTSIVALAKSPYAFVAMANVDRIATLSLTSTEPRAAGGTELRLYDRGPYGTQPVALAVTRDEKRLYVALAGIDAVAVLDVSQPLHPHRVGLIPTGWYPAALALSRDERYLYVANTKGYAEDRGFMGDPALPSDAIWSTLQRIDLRATSLRQTTPLALASLRAIAPAKADRVVPPTFAGAGSGAIKHVVFVLAGSDTYDAMLGDLRDSFGRAHGSGDPNDIEYPEPVTPNLHALARDFALAGNFYADAQNIGAGHQFATGGIASAYTERTTRVSSAGKSTRASQDPEDYPRAGYIFNALADRGKSYRDYGELLRLAGYGASTSAPSAAALGLGGVYAYDVPAPLALSGHVDLNYPGWNPNISNARRVAEFERDYDAFEQSATTPAFAYVWLPDITTATSIGASDDDQALGELVDHLSHAATWPTTAIFVVPDDATASRDHVAGDRSYAIVISPYARRGYVGMRHTSTVSVLKTEEEILGLPALSLGDALATDLSDLFTTTPVLTPFQHIATAPPATR